MSGESATADGKKLAYLQWGSHFTTYVADLDSPGTNVMASRHFTLTGSQSYPEAWTPDGKAIIFISNGKGATWVYRQLLNADSAHPMATPDEDARNAEVTPDGKWVLYFAHPDKPAAPGFPHRRDPVMRVSMDGGPSQLVLTANGVRSQISCARPSSDLCVIAEASEDRKQVIVDAVWCRSE
jgi:Tol biopolymer transport system component